MKADKMYSSAPKAVAQYVRAEFLSRDGYEVVIASDYWRLSKDVAFNLDWLSEYLNDDMKLNFKQVLAIYAQTCSSRHAENMHQRLKEFLRATSNQNLFSPESIISYRAQLIGDEWKLSSVRAFIRTWVSTGYKGIPSEALPMMEKWRIKGNEKGFHVQSMCPESGPLTDIEMDGIVSGVLECYSSGRLGLRDTCYAMILAMTGRRSIQITSLKIKDIQSVEGKYCINFPRGKQRYGKWRNAFKKFPIVEDLWLLLQSQVESVKALFDERVTGGVSAKLVPELPVFPAMDKYTSSESLEELLSGDFLHAPTSEIGYAMKVVKSEVAVISERTGAIIHMNPNRFRYTLGTNLAREGKGEYVIAEALDHSDTQNAGVYIRNIPEFVEQIDKAVALQLAPLAQAFRGVLVVNEAAARRGGDSTSRICSSGGNVGSCGSFGFCGALAPIACYTCSYFQPWLDGPHELVLDQLISERDSVLQSTRDPKIASVNDRLILAVSDVVIRCKAMKSEPAHV